MSTSCVRQGCGQTFDPASNPAGSCSYHSGAPFFHEGMKSWSCCKDVNKPVMEFEQFMKLPGCTKSSHTDVKPVATAPAKADAASSDAPSLTAAAPTTVSSSGVETYGAPPPPPASSSSKVDSTPAPAVAVSVASEPAKPVKEEEDDPELPVPQGAKCKRRACGVEFSGTRGDGECIYHSGVPIFREGSKGYTCCKRRVLEFDEFLKIQGCKTGGNHLFVGSKPDPTAEREIVASRMDHYQTPTQVHVSVYAKQVDKATSSIVIEEQAIHLDLHLPQNKRTLKTIALFGPIDPSKSTFSILGTKVALTLQKSNGISWPLLEGGGQTPQGYALTFGVGGRTGSVGAKEMILSEEQKRAEQEKKTATAGTA